MAPKLVKTDKDDLFADFELVSQRTAAPRSGQKLTPEQNRRKTFLNALDYLSATFRQP